MSYLNDTLERIAAIQETIIASEAPRSTIGLAEPYMPSQVLSANCPFFINELTDGNSDIPISTGQQFLSITVPMVLCVARKEASTNLRLGVDTTARWLTTVYETFGRHIRLSDPEPDSSENLGPLQFLVDAVIKKWSAGTYSYGDAEFLSIKFTLVVRMMYPTTITV